MKLILILSLSILFILIFAITITGKKQIQNWKIIILPYWIKIVGFGILIICSIVPSVVNINEIDYLSHLRDLIVLIGLIMIFLSKEKDENEILNKIRFFSITISFLALALFYPFFVLINSSDEKVFNPSHLMGYILSLTIIIFYTLKRKMSK